LVTVIVSPVTDLLCISTGTTSVGDPFIDATIAVIIIVITHLSRAWYAAGRADHVETVERAHDLTLRATLT
jgi:hypothetical protein